MFQGAFVPEIAQVLQQQWDAVGVNLSLRPTTNIVEDLNRATAPLVSIPRSGAGRGKLNNFSGPSTSNFCQYNDPELEGLITQLAAVTDSSEEGQQLWHEIQQIMVEDALLLPLVFQPRLYAARFRPARWLLAGGVSHRAPARRLGTLRQEMTRPPRYEHRRAAWCRS